MKTTFINNTYKHNQKYFHIFTNKEKNTSNNQNHTFTSVKINTKEYIYYKNISKHFKHLIHRFICIQKY